MEEKYRKRYKDLRDLCDFEKMLRDIIADYDNDLGPEGYSVEAHWSWQDGKIHIILECSSVDGAMNYRQSFRYDPENIWATDSMFDHFTHELVIKMVTVDEPQDWTIKEEFKDTIREYLHNLPAGKCLVMGLDGARGEHRTFFLGFDEKWPSFRRALCYFDLMDGPGTDVEHEFNVVHFDKAVDLEDRWHARYINDRWIPGKSTCLVAWGEFPDDPEYELGKWYVDETLALNSVDHDPFYRFGDVVSVEIVDMDPGASVEAFSRKYMRDMHPEMVGDIPDDPRIDEAYAKCRSYNPEAFDDWKDYFCRKRCRIDTGAGCGSNCCKVRVIQFVDAQYSHYKIPSVDGQKNRFKEET